VFSNAWKGRVIGLDWKISNSLEQNEHKRLGKLTVGYISDGCTVPEIVSLFKLWLVQSAKESNNKPTGHETYSVFQSVATWFEYLYSPEQYLLGCHVREEVRVYRKESFLMSRRGRSMEWRICGNGTGCRKHFICSYSKSCGNVCVSMILYRHIQISQRGICIWNIWT
jgi:hypothetical protein